MMPSGETIPVAAVTVVAVVDVVVVVVDVVAEDDETRRSVGLCNGAPGMPLLSTAWPMLLGSMLRFVLTGAILPPLSPSLSSSWRVFLGVHARALTQSRDESISVAHHRLGPDQAMMGKRDGENEEIRHAGTPVPQGNATQRTHARTHAPTNVPRPESSIRPKRKWNGGPGTRAREELGQRTVRDDGIPSRLNGDAALTSTARDAQTREKKDRGGEEGGRGWGVGRRYSRVGHAT